MDIHATRQQMIQDQENVYVGKGKAAAVFPVKRKGFGVRGALDDVNTNVQPPRDVNAGKVVEATAEFERKASLNRGPLRSNYDHVQSKVNTGLASKTVQPSSRPPLRREESTAALAAKASVRTKAALKETVNKPAKPKESSTLLLPTKKSSLDKENKKIAKLPIVKEKEQTKAKEAKSLKTVIKDPTESMGKLKLAEPAQKSLLLKDKEPLALREPLALPADIEDIDRADIENPLLLSAYVQDIYSYLKELEIIYPIEPDHLKNQNVITGNMRGILVDWLVEVNRQFSLLLETFQLTIGIMDRYLQTVPNVQRDRLQLIGVTAMYLASKYEEVYAPDVNDFVCVTDNAYTKADIFTCEREMLSKLGFCLARPIPLSFLRRYVKAAHGSAKHHHLAKYFVDLCLVEYTVAHYRPSEMAASALCLSIHLLSNKKLEDAWTPTLVYYTQYNLEHIEPIVRKIAKIVVNVDKSKFKAVPKKYLDVSLAKVSSLPHLKGEAIYELANNDNLSADLSL